ncbi:hypothetical protein L218DRAFT_999140 [Marasmius fiardii PR-910]|nr:hypothetical protein L218DRAFT_999140 [Marasmius fiardii PR-910]
MATDFLPNSMEALPPVHDLKFPVFQSFFEVWRLPDKEMWPWFWQAIYGAPRLVRFSSTHLETNPLFSQLISWEMRDPGRLHDSSTFFEVLQSCSHLKSLTLTGTTDLNTESSWISRQVKLPYLRQLSISVSSDRADWFSAVAQSLILPSFISCHIQSTELPLPATSLTIVRRSSTSLKRLGLIRPCWGANHPSLILDLLQAAPELTHFELTFDLDSRPQVVDDTVTILLSKIKEGPHDFLPKLGSLFVDSWDITLTTQLAERVLETVSSRRETSHPLVELRIGRRGLGRWFLKPKVLERIRVLKEGGVRIVIADGIKS